MCDFWCSEQIWKNVGVVWTAASFTEHLLHPHLHLLKRFCSSFFDLQMWYLPNRNQLLLLFSQFSSKTWKESDLFFFFRHFVTNKKLKKHQMVFIREQMAPLSNFLLLKLFQTKAAAGSIGWMFYFEFPKVLFYEICSTLESPRTIFLSTFKVNLTIFCCFFFFLRSIRKNKIK